MPFYEYACSDCNAPFDIKATVAEYEDGLNTDCPLCESESTKRVFSAAYVSTSGSAEPMPVGPSCGCGMGGSCGLD